MNLFNLFDLFELNLSQQITNQMISLNVATVRSLGKGNITTMWNEWQGYITFKYKKLEDSITIKNNYCHISLNIICIGGMAMAKA